MRLPFFAVSLLIAMTAIGSVRAAAQSALRPVVVPFFYAHHELLVRARINGAGPYEFLLDTDTTPSAIDLALAKKLHLLRGSRAGSGSGVGTDRIVVFPLTIASVQLGALHAANVDALATDLSGLRAGLGRPIAGILGTSLLHDRVMQLDYACRRVSFLPDAPLAPFTARFRTSSSSDNVSDDVWVGRQRASATFDTGDAGYGFVTRKGIGHLHLAREAARGEGVTARGYGGVARETKGVLPSLRIGTISLGSISTNFMASSDDPFDLNIGNRTLERFIVTFDYQRGLLTLQTPRSAACSPLTADLRSGNIERGYAGR